MRKYHGLITVLFAGLALSAPLKAQQATVAVFDFQVGDSLQLETKTRSDGDTERVSVERSRQSNLLTNRLVHELVRSGDITVVEREKLRRIMDEARFSRSDLAKPDRAMKIGEALGADYMIFGAITQAKPNIQVEHLPYDAGTQRTMTMSVGANARLVNVETGVVEASSDASLKKKQSITDTSGSAYRVPRDFQQDAYGELAGNIATQLLASLNPVTVAYQKGEQVYLAQGNMPEGSRCEVVVQGEAIKDPTTGEVLGRAEQPLALLEITRGMKKLSQARVVKWLGDSETLSKGAHCRPVADAD